MRTFRRRVGFHVAWIVFATGAWALAIIAFVRNAPHLARALPFLTLLYMLLVGATARGIVRRISRPIELLTEASRRLGAGDLSHRVLLPPYGPRRHRRRPLDELLLLGVAWNEMAERIERLVRGQRELLANVSHELRSPLARIRVALELLPRTAETGARVDEVVADIEELDRLIDDVLTAARLDGPAFTPRREEVALRPLLDGLVARAGHDPLTAGRAVTVAAVEVESVTADPALIKRALWNLVENGAKHGAPPIALGVERKDGVVALTVTDAGPGIPADERARVDEPFVRGAGAHERGVGLGLTIARRVAEVHGGRLILLDGPGGRGLRAKLELPA
jgi:signal transduction histidine kinase